MAYVGDISGSVVDATSSITVSLPPHVADDIILVVLTQDSGGTTISTVTSGWANVGGQSASGGSRQACFWKKAASSSETNPVFTGTNNDWVYSAIVIKDVDTTTALDGSNRLDWNGIQVVASPTITTTNDDDLLIYTWGWDNNKFMIPSPAGGLTYVDKRTGSGCGHIVGSKYQESLGLTPVVSAIHDVSNEGGNAFVIAFKNKVGGENSRDVKTNLSRIEYSKTYAAPTTILATLDSKTVSSNSYSNSTAAIGWGTTNGSLINAVMADGYSGITTSLDSVQDMTDSIFSVMFLVTNIKSQRFGEDGVAIVFSDSSGNWEAHQMNSRANMVVSTMYTFHVSVGVTTPLDSSGTLDITDITDITYLIHRVGSTTGSSTLRILNPCIRETSVVVGGSSARPLAPSFMQQAFSDWGFVDQSNLQGSSQGLNYAGFQLGDGSATCYTDFTAQSFEIGLLSILNKTDDYKQPFIIYASANDVVNLKSCVILTTVANNFELHASSSTSATYDFTGSSIVGWDIINRSGITINGANITGGTITQNGGSFDLCNIENSLMTATTLATISDCNFISGGTGHAIEITVAGTYSFSANQFSGFGADATTDAGIYNNSGGLVTINIVNGGATPTIRNGAGASTVVNNSVSIDIYVFDQETKLKNTQARVHMIAEAGGPLTTGTVIINAQLVDANGEISITANAANQPYSGLIVDALSTGLFVPQPISGTIPSAGLSLDVGLISDE